MARRTRGQCAHREPFRCRIARPREKCGRSVHEGATDSQAMCTLAAVPSRETHTPRASLAARRTLPAILSRGPAGPRRICGQCAHWGRSCRTGSGVCDESLGSAHAGATETRVMCTLEPIPSQPLTRAATSSNPMCTLVAVPSRGLRGRCDDLGSNVHIGPPFVAGPQQARDGLAGNVHIGSISVAGQERARDAFKGNVHIRSNPVAWSQRVRDESRGNVHIEGAPVAGSSGPATESRVVRTPARRERGQCAHWGPIRRENRTLPALLSPRSAHSPRFSRRTLPGCDGSAGNVHIGSVSVAALAKSRDAFGPNVHIARASLAGSQGRRDDPGPNVHIGRRSVAGPGRVAMGTRAMCTLGAIPSQRQQRARGWGANPHASSLSKTKPSAPASRARESRTSGTLAQGLARPLTPPPRSPRHRRQR